ncbi:hypothetical protein EZJ43_06540 [Pedobacter changchengzhani]|uniref:Preprotein translocase subunit SecA n=1 Tax=Pedobacter changchengzhani TaxID=2529274 RepID=A0A4R5MMM5_9SPHI|nr:preprotein translocase subunit SecA [Pedobacter changchengzhani]TDG36934.1 hypothetical protein EZJ43_06540 [Pedobacter changchengzhani]
MFGLFGKKEKSLKVIDNVWITEQAKFAACVAHKKNNAKVIFVAWFEETKNKLHDFFLENGIEDQIYLADRLSIPQQDSELIFVEHHPLRAEEERKATEFGVSEITVFSSISEPLFKLFGGDRIAEMMQKMGMREDEIIQHDMISKSIKNAQEKIASKSIINGSGRSQGDWLLNVGLNKESF